MDRRVAAKEKTPATMVVAVVNFSPVPPGTMSLPVSHDRQLERYETETDRQTVRRSKIR